MFLDSPQVGDQVIEATFPVNEDKPLEPHVELLLFKQLAAGGEQAHRAFERLYRHYFRLFERYLMRKYRAEKHDVEEIVQEVLEWAFISSPEQIIQWVEEKPGRTARMYLFRKCASTAIDHYRRSRNEPTRRANGGDGDDEIIDSLPNPQPSPEDELSTREILWRALTRFRESDPECYRILSFKLLGYADTEIAERIERTHTATRQKLTQCRKKLQKLIRELGDDLLPPQN